MLETYREHWPRGSGKSEDARRQWKEQIAPGLRENARQWRTEAENHYRELYGIPKIGEGWVSETQLYRTLRTLLAPVDVIQHGSPDWLKPQHFDVWVPDLQCAFEYQGRQHFEAIEYFGGEEGLRNRMVLDKRKTDLAREHKVRLVYFHEGEDIPDQVLKELLRQAR